MTKSIAYLSRLCRRWGGSLELVSDEEFSALSPPVSWHPDGWHAINIGSREVFAARDHANPGTVIHEMGHVFLSEGDPKTTDETEWLGWEIVLARRAGCYSEWSAQNHDYLIDSYEWRELLLDVGHLRRTIADRIAYAQEIGIVSPRGVPLCTRRA